MHGGDQNRAPGSGLFGRYLIAAGQRNHTPAASISSVKSL